jgi:putative MATE family efflux protein
MSQFWGKKDIKSLHKVLGIALGSSILVGILFFIGAQIIPEELIRIYSPDREVIETGALYLKMVSWSYVITAISMVYGIQLRSVGVVKLGVYTGSISLIINIFFNYILIFGKLGFPTLGILGAAIATVIARTVELIIILVVVYNKKYALACKIKEMINIDKLFIKRFMKTTVPVTANEMFWALGMTGYAMVYGRMGTDSIAIINIVDSINRILFTGMMGIASAAAVMIGNKIGEKDEKTAIKYAYMLGKISIYVGFATSLILLITIKPLLSFYNLEDTTYKLVIYTTYVLAFLIPFKSFSTTTVVGILRGGGDVKYCLALDITALWLVGIPLVIYGGLGLGLPIYIVYGLAGSEEIIKFIFSVRRIISKKWIRNLVEDM